MTVRRKTTHLVMAGALALLAGTVLLEACPGGSDGTFISPVESVEVFPANMTVTCSPGEPAEVEFLARVTRKNGDVDETALAAWETTNLALGAIDEVGGYISTDQMGGITIIRASFLGVTGETEMTVIYSATEIDESLPEGVDELFTGDADVGAEDAPTLLYPLDGVRIPRNTAGITFMWDAGPTANLYRLRFRSLVTHIDVITDQVSWEAEESVWRAIANGNAGSATTVELAGLAYSMDGDTPVADSAVLEPEAPSTMHVSRLDASGSIYYWSTTNVGVYRIIFGNDHPEAFYGNNNYGHCVSCHVLSPDGTQMAVTYEGAQAKLGLVSVDDPANPDTTIIANEDEVLGNFKTFSPDGTKLLVSHSGKLAMIDAVAGEWMYDIVLDEQATMPSWSPSGDRIAVVLVDPEDFDYDYHFIEGQIALLYVDGDGNIDTEPDIIVPREAGVNHYYPAFSPDGDWIAYNRSLNDAQDWESWDSYDDPSAQVRIISSDGSVSFELPAANADGRLTNSWPGWAPLPDADVAWLTFSSKRDYGFLNVLENNRPQIWVAAFDLEVALSGNGEDPSSPPFWLPYQNVETNNHIAAWGQQ